jgi:lipoprotein-anchoring transpeptidase ErfK/SrfK
MLKQKYRDIVFWAIILIPYLCLIPAFIWYLKTLKNVENSSFIIISKADLTLYHYNYKGKLLQKSSVSTGKNAGNKEKIGDLKTPEGVFTISNIEDASDWKHDFKDDTLGKIEGAYGPYFIRLNTPGHKGIGIHGTHDDNSINTRASEGCIRMHNDELIRLVQNIKTASVVVITPGINDVRVNAASDIVIKLDDSEKKPKIVR